MSSEGLGRGFPGDSHRQNHPTFESSSSIKDRQPSMSVGYLTRGVQPRRDNPPYDINGHYYNYSQPMMQQHNGNSNIHQQHQQQHQPQRPQPSPHQQPQRGGTSSQYSEQSTSSGPASSLATASTASSLSSHTIAQQTPRITLPPLSAITENQDSQQTSEGAAAGQNAPNTPAAPGPPSYPPQRAQQSQQVQHPSQSPHPQSSHQPSQGPQQQQQQQQQSSSQQPSSSSYPPRPSPQYESQPQQYQRNLHPSPQIPPEQPRYPPGQMTQQMGLQPHQMPMQQMPPNPQLGQFPSPVPTPTHFPPQSQYPYPQSPYPPQSMYSNYGHQAQYMPPGVPHQPAYATSHRQRPPQYSPYPTPSGFAPPPPPQAQSWPPQQDYIAQPLTPMTAHSPQQPYSPQMQQPGSGSGGPLRVRRTSSGLSQSPYPSPGDPSQPPAPPQQQVKPKRKRATSGQLRVLNNVFEATFFPSTELRIALGKELGMSPRTVQIWFQNKRQAWRANKAKTEHATTQQMAPKPTTPSSSQPFPGSGSYSPHHLRQEHYNASPGHTRMASSTEDLREEGMENDEGGGWAALRMAQEENRGSYRQQMGEHEEDIGYEDDIGNQPPHRRHH